MTRPTTRRAGRLAVGLVAAAAVTTAVAPSASAAPPRCTSYSTAEVDTGSGEMIIYPRVSCTGDNLVSLNISTMGDVTQGGSGEQTEAIPRPQTGRVYAGYGVTHPYKAGVERCAAVLYVWSSPVGVYEGSERQCHTL